MSSSLDSDFYDRSYFDGGKGYHTYQDAEHFGAKADEIIRLFNPTSVLDIGCAKGYLVRALRQRGVPAFGIDISEYAIDQAPEDVQDFLFNHDITSGKEVQFPRCELIVSLDTFEHIPKEKLENVKKFMEKFGEKYFVRVGTTQTPNWQHDPSHINMHRIEWWTQWWPEVFWEESM